jgi:hypothetical protein
MVGVALVIVGAVPALTEKIGLFAVSEEPPSVVLTDTGPLVAPTGTMVTSEVELAQATSVALVPLKDTAESGVKLVPVMVTRVPTGPVGGVSALIVGMDGVVAAPTEITLCELNAE